MQKRSIDHAIELLNCEGVTLALYDGKREIISKKRGVSPLLEFLDNGESLSTFSCADRVVGKGAAFLYVLLKAKELYTHVISEEALKTLKKFGIPVTFHKWVPCIINRKGDGICPVESAVLNIEDPERALIAIRNRIAELSGK